MVDLMTKLVLIVDSITRMVDLGLNLTRVLEQETMASKSPSYMKCC
jgi:hypothetical protein